MASGSFNNWVLYNTTHSGTYNITVSRTSSINVRVNASFTMQSVGGAEYCRMFGDVIINGQNNLCSDRSDYGTYWAGENYNASISVDVPVTGAAGKLSLRTNMVVYDQFGREAWAQGVDLSFDYESGETFTITFDANGGSGAPTAQSGDSGTQVTISSDKPTKAEITANVSVTFDVVEPEAVLDGSVTRSCVKTTSFSFSKWVDTNDDTKSYTSGQVITITGNMNLRAEYEPTVSGSIELPTPTLAQYKFLGWSKSTEDIKILSSPYSPDGNETLYAIWGAGEHGGMLRIPYNAALDVITVGGKVRLIGCKDPSNNAVYTVAEKSRSGDKLILVFEEDFAVSLSQDAAEDNLQIWSGGTYVPDFDYICECHNRLWGCSSKTRTIYASALGEPDDFDLIEDTTLDSYAVAVPSAGDFTGCVAMNNYVLFTKQHYIHKMMGAFPAEYALYTFTVDGVSESNAHSLKNCSGLGIFIGEHGIVTYSGSNTGTLSKELGEGGMKDGIADFNGEKYSLFYKDSSGKGHTYVYDTRYGIWLEENYGNVLAFAHLGDKDYVLVQNDTRNAVYLINSGQASDDEWELEFREFYESVTGSYKSTSHIFEKKRYCHIYLRLELPKGSWLKAEVSCDGLPYRKIGRIEGKSDKVETFVLSTPRCDKLKLKLSGKGKMAILGMEREFMVGSAR